MGDELTAYLLLVPDAGAEAFEPAFLWFGVSDLKFKVDSEPSNCKTKETPEDNRISTSVIPQRTPA